LKGGRIAASRRDIRLTGVQAGHIARAANARLCVFYDTGFNLHSLRQFCSRFVREILEEATGIVVGKAETFTSLLDRNPAPACLAYLVFRSDPMEAQYGHASQLAAEFSASDGV